MTDHMTSQTTASSSANAELEALVALVTRLALASNEATRLAVEVQGKLSGALGVSISSGTTWARAPAKTPTQLENEFPEGSGEVWYVVIRGREPGLYRTPPVGSRTTSARRKTSRREAILFYRDNYVAAVAAAHAASPAHLSNVGWPGSTSSAVATPVGVQKWVQISGTNVV
ncbi:hypothetical protein B0H15DRAFT_956840 [Mycena belliarum]|uniref:Uncharacterized protein n=1 Tax=Mycena belliarum TaxID=1033014 RepID=A0AAD6TR14_9AGAR|nr:hypothetical protein B0H15DRAFT_956840 [Mycena belliae]